MNLGGTITNLAIISNDSDSSIRNTEGHLIDACGEQHTGQIRNLATGTLSNTGALWSDFDVVN